MNFTQWICHYDKRTDKNQELEKAAVKNALIDAVAQVYFQEIEDTGYVEGIGDNQPVVIGTYHLSYKLGLMKVHKERSMKKNGMYSKSWKTQQEVVTKDPDEIVKFVFQDDSLSASEVLNPRQTWNLIVEKFGDNEAMMKKIGQMYENTLAKGITTPSYIRF